MTLDGGVLALAIALRELQSRFELDSVAATNPVPDGHMVTLRWSGDVLSVERDDGAVSLLSTEAIL